MAESDPFAEIITGRAAYHLNVPGTDSAAALSVVSFEAVETMGEPNVVKVELTHPQQLSRADYLNLDAVFSIQAENGATKKFSGYIERFSTIQTTKDYTKYQIVLKSHFGRLQAVTNTRPYQHVTTPQIIETVVRRHGIPDHLISFRLRRQYPVHLWRFQYQMTDFDYVHMLMERAGIYCYVVETEHGDQIVFADDISQLRPQRPRRDLLLRLHLQHCIALIQQMLPQDRTQPLTIARFKRFQHLAMVVHRAIPLRDLEVGPEA
jgi:type VI secretion system secreted protein VgrG